MSTSVIWKFRESLDNAEVDTGVGTITMDMPITAKVTSAQMSNYGLSIWAEVTDKEVPVEGRTFVFVATGADFDPTGLRLVNVTHVASQFHEHGFVFHIYERTA